MKLKKLGALLKKRKHIELLLSGDIETGEMRQWVSDGAAIYPLDGLPTMDVEQLCTVLDIRPEKRGDYFLSERAAPENLNLQDEGADILAQLCGFSINTEGETLIPLKYGDWIYLFAEKYITPVEDEKDINFYIRKGKNGKYVAVKAGLFVVALIAPYNITAGSTTDALAAIAAQAGS